MTSETMIDFLDQRALERVDGAIDQVGAVVGRHDSTPGGRPAASSASFALTRSMTPSAFSPIAHDHDAADRFALAVELGDAAPEVRPDLHGADVAHADRVPPGPAPTATSRDIVRVPRK